MNSLLTVDHLTMSFSGLVALDDVSFTAEKNAITAIIGPNGAGKTTVFNCLTGFYRPTSGALLLDNGHKRFSLEKMKDFKIAKKAKVARTFQNIRLFPKMSALENLLVAQHNNLMKASLFTIGGLLGLRSYKKAQKRVIELAAYWLAKTGLINYADSEAGNLSYGDQRRLEIARAMCTNPALLCLDEPAAGLNPSESAQLCDLILKIKQDSEIGILLIEHDMSVVMGISDHIIVLDYGRKIAQGSPKNIRENPEVIAAYLGEDLREMEKRKGKSQGKLFEKSFP
ncbi:leucine/isoleucine/valine transporter ATP-binding subunit [Candidatus Magnetoovum chiemensis]|nr:leucine/isoleucine/valine transporter ATP-binding subunit [Candidatus Magnetoovum chiemensis]